MSFVARNKTWLLPLLAIGIGAVAWYDLKSFGTPAPASAPAATPTSPAAAPTDPSATGASLPAPSSPAPSASPASSLPPLNPDAWADLSLLNGARGALGRDEDLASQATRPLSEDQLASFRAAGAAATFSTPSLLTFPGATGSASEPPPMLEFISRTPEGLRAWYQGVGYTAGQAILGSAYRVREIRPPRVIVEGPAGPVAQSTFLFQESSDPTTTKETP